MKKRVLVIGNNRGLSGVKIDIINYEKFLRSSFGGQWHTNEIIKLMNPTLEEVFKWIEYLKSIELDYLILYFSGHGGYERSTILELNHNGECISENSFCGIAKRQLTIFDCCRSYESDEASLITLSDSYINKTAINTREKYENRIMQATKQHVKLYSCKKGESSYDTEEGGLYTKNLIQGAYNHTPGEIDISHIHKVAKVKVNYEESTQNPEAVLPKVLLGRELIFGISIRLNS